MRLSTATCASSLLLTLLPTAVFADVEIVSPAASASIPAGPITVTWQDSGESPKLSQLTSYTLQLVVGGNTQSSQTIVQTLTATGKFSAGDKFTGTIDPSKAGNTPLGYFIQITSTASEGGTVINYSSRFSVSGMTGTTPPNAVSAVTALKGSTAGPQRQNNVANAAANGADTAVADPAAAGKPYSLQTVGPVKYAPMQGVPPTKITKQDTSPLYPTSAFSKAIDWFPPASFTSTITPSQTHSVQSIENTAAAQSNPTGDMAKFLARWKD